MKGIDLKEAYRLIDSKIEHWIEILINMLPNAVVALGILLFAIFIARLMKKFSRKLLAKFSENVGLNELAVTILYILVISLGLFSALSVLQLDRALTSLLTGAGIVGLALSFAFQDSASNFIAGIFLAIRKPVNIGDVIESKGVMGKIKEMSLRNTLIESFQGQYIYVPNKEIYQNQLINYTQPGTRRVDIPLGISYGDDLARAQKVIVDTIKGLPFVKKEEEAGFVYEEYGSSSINGKVMFWIDYHSQKSYLTARSDAITAIKAALDKENITIPFPIRTLDFGNKSEELFKHISNKKN